MGPLVLQNSRKAGRYIQVKASLFFIRSILLKIPQNRCLLKTNVFQEIICLNRRLTYGFSSC